MTKFFKWLMVLFVPLFSSILTSCSDDNKNEPEYPTCEIVGTSNFTVSSDGGAIKVTFTSNSTWVIEPSEAYDGVKITNKSGQEGYNVVAIKFDENHSLWEVCYDFRIRDAEKGRILATFSVTQDAGNFYIECDDNIDLPYEDCEIVIPVVSNDEIVANVRDEDKSWLDAYIVKDLATQTTRYSLCIHATKPPYEKGRVRLGKIVVCGSADIKKVIFIFQKCSD